ncbi:hypothetical protein TCON_0264 [Astathelohania contejeani]|uniref:Uncharacterized protein n=1 Tax=Astathelohania contejeani TaxID=164912 RepID=A0ABQ7I2D7_9MICR|nr:hypothetical protein TCON_0264 [Thelohania contejeani]
MPSSNFILKKIRIVTKILPHLLDNPLSSINQTMQSYLMLYSHKLGGTLLAFQVVGIASNCYMKHEEASVYLECMVECLVYSLSKGDAVKCRDGCILGVFEADQEGSGILEVLEITTNNQSVMRIKGKLI